MKEFARFEFEYVSAITVEQMAEAIDAIKKRGVETQAQKSRTVAKILFKWLGRAENRSKTGVTVAVMKDLEKPQATLREEGGDGANRPRVSVRVPSDRDLGRLMRTFLDPEWDVHERDRLAALLTMYTVQRRYTVTQARRADFEPADGGGGIWKVPPAHLKTASEKARRGIDVGMHVVPLPEPAWDVVKRAMALSETAYLFPPMRPRRKGKSSPFVDESSITHTFLSVTGNLCGPHDMRRGFGTTYGNTIDLDEGLAKTLYDHSGGVKSGDVTRKYYMFKRREHRLWPVVTGWIEYLHVCAKLWD